jgi:hypothetical protein
MKKLKKIQLAIRKVLPLHTDKSEKPALPQLKWKGSLTDLMEIVYVVYLTKALKNEKEREATIGEVTKVIFGTFEMEIPKNPTRIVDNIKHRKNPRDVSKVLNSLYQLYQEL